MRDTITIKGARENNLRNIDLEIPRDQLIVVTGVSGSGKSSLPFARSMPKHSKANAVAIRQRALVLM
jgi:excinuclease UvrABC ATPase subunit